MREKRAVFRSSVQWLMLVLVKSRVRLRRCDLAASFTHATRPFRIEALTSIHERTTHPGCLI